MLLRERDGCVVLPSVAICMGHESVACGSHSFPQYFFASFQDLVVGVVTIDVSATFIPSTFPLFSHSVFPSFPHSFFACMFRYSLIPSFLARFIPSLFLSLPVDTGVYGWRWKRWVATAGDSVVVAGGGGGCELGGGAIGREDR